MNRGIMHMKRINIIMCVVPCFLALTLTGCPEAGNAADADTGTGDETGGAACDPVGANPEVGGLLNAPVADDVEVIVKVPQHPGLAGPDNLP
jgi:hypothetical protein